MMLTGRSPQTDLVSRTLAKAASVDKLLNEVPLDISAFKKGEVDIEELTSLGFNITNGSQLIASAKWVNPGPAGSNNFGGMTNFNTPPMQLWGGAGGVPQWTYDETGQMRPVVNFLDQTSGQGMYFGTGASIGGGYPQPAMGGQQPTTIADLKKIYNPPRFVPTGTGGGMTYQMNPDGSYNMVQMPKRDGNSSSASTSTGGATPASGVSPELMKIVQLVAEGKIDPKVLGPLLGVSLPSSLSSFNTGSSSGLDSLFINSDEDLEAALEDDSSEDSLFG